MKVNNNENRAHCESGQRTENESVSFNIISNGLEARL